MRNAILLLLLLPALTLRAQVLHQPSDLLLVIPSTLDGAAGSTTADFHYNMDGTVDGSFAFITFVAGDGETLVNFYVEDRLNSPYLQTLHDSYMQVGYFENENGSYSRMINKDSMIGFVSLSVSPYPKRSVSTYDFIYSNRYHITVQIVGEADRKWLDSLLALVDLEILSR
jgi:predicted ATP-dependent Lon-type protease